MFSLEYSDGWYIEKDGVSVIDFPNGDSDAGFAQWVCDTLNASQRAQQTVSKHIEKMQECVEDGDAESAHGKADQLLCEFLRELGYNELAEKYDEVKKWYE